MSIPTHKPIVDYFQSLNELNVNFPEKSFSRMDLNEIMGQFRTGVNFPHLAVESHDGNLDESSHSNNVNGRTFAFTVYQNPKAGNFAQQNEMLDQCERLGLQIIARMRHDANDPDHILYRRFETNSVNYIKVGPVFNEELYGYRFTGVIKGTESLKPNAADWSDLDTICP
ncbi:hypothetical protein MG296_10510 [Flavobacteriaceae bacterium TK19130]|nr:hypothetical protein [Thermobacterium salinum]